MQSNLEKWNLRIAIIDKKLRDWVNTICDNIPEKFYLVHPSGRINECFITEPYYIYPFNTFFKGKTPTKQEITKLYLDSQEDLVFTTDKLSFNHYYIWNEAGNKAKTGISYKDLFPPAKNIFLNKDDADAYGQIIIDQRAKDLAFDTLHKKDKHYDYAANGYKFLGWQNSWKDTWYDESGNETTDRAKRKSTGYSKENYPEYRSCRDQGHRTIEVSHDNRGTQHDVSCPECKLLWRYDSSD